MKKFKQSAYFIVIIASVFSLNLTSCTSLNSVEKKKIDEMNKNFIRLNEQLIETDDRLQKIEQKVEFLKNSTIHLQNRLNNQNQKINAVASQKKITSSVKTSNIDIKNYTEPDILYQKARSLLLEENFKRAGELFKEFAAKYPKAELADNALYWLGECHYSMNDYKKAIKIFKALVKKYPKAGKVPDALLKTAYAYLLLDDMDRAHHYFKIVVKKYPFTQAGEKAEQKLKVFQ